ncbi:M20/M25/M40 family metallo-hydrolase [Iningainema tapete]|uniref:M28 family peptidase n=1 Tax=Iningainema tapete BLCC-T55 TaxID=2748662 RepID=A0A8J6XT08_9CYAN|nr:M20/M25/M40 family metallo-hydrolase [Iningainema tapete]MBD2776991.1 M28 family peptidase [Iningainema tapete BLCC-T55]
MKKWIWLALFVLMTLIVVGGSKLFPPTNEQPLIIDTIRVSQPQPIQKAQNYPSPYPLLQVSADKLFAHVQRLNFTRYTPAERSRTRKYITTELKRLGWQPKLEKFSDGVNIFAERKGTDQKAGAILIGAHYDTVYISPGADDNASGVAVMLEMARLLGSRPTPRTLQLAFFDKEEAGLLGSKAFVKDSTHLENLQGVIVMDMVGYACYDTGCQKYPVGLPVTPPSDKGDFLAVIGDAEHLPLLNAFENPPTPRDSGGTRGSKTPRILANNEGSKTPRILANNEGSKTPLFKGGMGGSTPTILKLPVPLKGLLTPDVLRSDHAPFWYQGVGAVLVTDTANLRTSHYHQPSDLPATIDRKFFTGAAEVVVNATNILLKNSVPLKSCIDDDLPC